MKKLSLLTAIIILAGSATSQTVTVYETLPAGYKAKEANSSHHPGWRYTNARSLTLINPRSVASRIKVVKGLRVRPNGTSYSPMVARTVSIEVAMSDKGVVTVEPYYKSWSKHYGTNRTIVMVKKTINYPAVAKMASPPHPWNKSIDLPFDKPWIRTGAATDGICIDCKFFTTTTESKYWYADADYISKFGFGYTIGTGCPTTIHYGYAGGGYLGSSTGFYSYGYTRAAGDFALAFLGMKQVKIPIPGFPGCHLWTIPALFHPQVMKTSGTSGYTGRFYWGAVQPSWVGAKVISQIVAFTTTAKVKALRANGYQIGGGRNAKQDQATLYGYAFGTRPFNPDTSGAVYYSPAVAIFGVY